MNRAGLAVLLGSISSLVACAAAPQGGYDYGPCWQMPLRPDGIPQDDVVRLAIDGVWTLGCATVVGAGNGLTALHRVFVDDATYRAPDGTFTVALPGHAAVGDGPGLVIGESITAQRDYVAFVPRPAGGPAYSVAVLKQLPERYAGMDVVDFSHAAVTDVEEATHAADKPASTLERVYEQQITLEGQPAMFATFRRAGADSGPYYLVYFLEHGERAAILSVLWPADSLPTGPDPEAAIRTMDPQLQKFVNSFRLDGG